MGLRLSSVPFPCRTAGPVTAGPGVVPENPGILTLGPSARRPLTPAPALWEGKHLLRAQRGARANTVLRYPFSPSMSL